jgi:hypothetical protein
VDTQSLSFITVELQQLYYMQGCAMTAVVFWTVIRVCHDSRGVLDSRQGVP